MCVWDVITGLMMLSFTIVCHTKFKWSPTHHRTVDQKPRIRYLRLCARYVSVGSIIHQGSQSVYDNESWWTNLITSSRVTAARIGVSSVRRHGCEKWRRYGCKNLFECYCVFSHTVVYTVYSRSFGIVFFIWWGSFHYLVHRGRMFVIWFGVCMYTRVEFILFTTYRNLFCMYFVTTYSKGGGMFLDDLSEFLRQHKCRTDIKHVIVNQSECINCELDQLFSPGVKLTSPRGDHHQLFPCFCEWPDHFVYDIVSWLPWLTRHPRWL